MDAPWAHSAQQVLQHFDVNPEIGLSDSQVEKHVKVYGKNELPEDPPTPLWELILEQFKDQLVLILLGSAVISFILALLEEREPGSSLWTAFVEPSVILLILIANAAVGVIQESNAEQAIDALKEYSPDVAKVTRNGRTMHVNAVDIVPGDVLTVAVGDRIPADARLLSVSSNTFRVDQAILTGESTSVSKTNGVVDDKRAVKQDMVNMLFSGTSVVNGTARAVVVHTGSNTAIGDIHKSISSQISEKTPLKKKLDDFGDSLAKVITVICILVWLVNIRNFSDPAHHGYLKGAIYYFKIAVALAVAAIPEGLAAVITACLALGTQKMAKKNAIVRNLPSVETLGCTNVICSDKTGTLTTNQMSVAKFTVINEKSGQPEEFIVEGTTYAPTGPIKSSGGKLVAPEQLVADSIVRLAEISAVCNDAKIVFSEDKAAFTNVGEPTEAALKVLVEKIGCTDGSVMKELSSLSPADRASAVNGYYESSIPRLLTFEFSRDRKMMSVLVKRKGSKGMAGQLFAKGAPESVLEQCSFIRVGSTRVPLSAQLKSDLLERTLRYGKDGLRVLALAYSDVDDVNSKLFTGSQNTSDYRKFEQNLTFVGLAGMLDPPRPEVKGAVANCKAAGIRVIVITGDNKGTAETICRQIGIFGMNEDLTGKSYTGRELDDMTEAQKLEAVKNASLFTRTEPGHKTQLVDLLQSLGLVVAMTGDGVNDAPALKKADIGVAMGSGTDVAKLAADMVLADSNFATIELASHFHSCSTMFPEIGCAMFTNEMAKRATTMSLSILVTIEMFNAMNSLSENESLLRLPLWKNPFLVAAITLSMVMHVAILYIPFFTSLFAITPLNWVEWKAVLIISAPVILIDEALKFISVSLLAKPMVDVDN
ncbi:hypothetical protein M407DRAFT_72156 [Tulasnella calospora MUT 4182]|uniref:Calcium-transporting ATPase n=1 Tax=Tulasnella calospora MUT 4182 TaxID=1051891 RepID=A0A0C3M366_9AGAM|nr:hypothetical protein M407DRAFT_72156 [Tulasnella calospora MUT 4182]